VLLEKNHKQEMAGCSPQTPPSTSAISSGKIKYIFPVGVLFLLGTLFFLIGDAAENQTVQDVEKRHSQIEHGGDDRICQAVCEARRQGYTKRFGGDLLDRKALQGIFQRKLDSVVFRLKKDYGKYFEGIFVDPSTTAAMNQTRFYGYSPIGEESIDRLRRKLIIKVLQMQVSILELESNHSGCDCVKGVALSPRIRNVTATDMIVNASFAKYVWATGGHSAAAGHGNLYNESYTAFMESDLREGLSAIGIELEARNYAMGGTASATELSMVRIHFRSPPIKGMALSHCFCCSLVLGTNLWGGC